MNIFECKKLSIGYPEKVVCKDINFAVDKGDFVCIVGENGSGKSTLLKTILGLNKPLSGKVIFDKDFNRKLIGFLPQQTELQKDFPATVKEIVMSGFVGRMGWRPFYSSQEKDKADCVLKELGVYEHSSKSFKELSGGQQQRVLLARALCATDEMLFLDEPTNNLDGRSIKQFYNLISKLNRDNNITICMVTHDLERVIGNATKIVYMKDNIKFVGTKKDFLESEYAKNFGVEQEEIIVINNKGEE
ncbi:MAG: ABC transporter ATP-binding protein [Clostridiales bacterium]|nr:ABC transporter ATP-binding protein [Clostridiales bacterium]